MYNIYELDSIEQLEAFIQSGEFPAETLRQAWLEEYHRLFHYTNILEWNKLVRICEALHIVGWGDIEPVEAIAQKWINGSYYTKLADRTFHTKQDSHKGWNKHRDSFVLDGGSDQTYHGISQFASQRNPLPKNPLRFISSGNFQQSAQPFIDSLEELRDRLDQEMRQAEYGSDFSYLGIHCMFSHHDDPSPSVQYEYFHEESDVPPNFEAAYYIRPRYVIGKLAKRKGELKLEITRYYTRAEGELPLIDQKELFKQDLLYMVDVLEEKLKKKRYRTDLLKQDLLATLKTW